MTGPSVCDRKLGARLTDSVQQRREPRRVDIKRFAAEEISTPRRSRERSNFEAVALGARLTMPSSNAENHGASMSNGCRLVPRRTRWHKLVALLVVPDQAGSPRSAVDRQVGHGLDQGKITRIGGG